MSKGSIFDFKLFSKLMKFVKLYKGTYYFVLLSAILLSGSSIISPYLLKILLQLINRSDISQKLI